VQLQHVKLIYKGHTVIKSSIFKRISVSTTSKKESCFRN